MLRLGRVIYFSTILAFITFYAFSQPAARHKPYQGGFYVKNYKAARTEFLTYLAPMGCKAHETIASVGAGNGYKEVVVSLFTDSINWYLQDIDTSLLNPENFGRVYTYFNRMRRKNISGNFHLVIGGLKTTKLPSDTFDRVLMVNVYHELKYKNDIMEDVSRIMKAGGMLVIMEVMARQKGDRHTDCGLPKTWEPDFFSEMNELHYTLVKKDVVEPMSLFTAYTFKKAGIP